MPNKKTFNLRLVVEAMKDLVRKDVSFDVVVVSLVQKDRCTWGMASDTVRLWETLTGVVLRDSPSMTRQDKGGAHLCDSCIHRRDAPGSCHSTCEHPLALVSLVKPNGLRVVGSPHGIKHGWFAWPLNFDPLWLEQCSGYTKKPKEEEGAA